MNEQDEIDWYLSLKQTILDGETEDAIKAIDGAIKLREREQNDQTIQPIQR